MKVLIVDDSSVAIQRIQGNLSASDEMVFLDISDPHLAHRIVDFGIKFDVALIDLRFGNVANAAGDFDGLAVCQKIRKAMADVVIVGYSTSFSLDSDENRQFESKFLSMGADTVHPLSYLTQTPASDLSNEFRSLRGRHAGSGYSRIRPNVFVGSSKEQLQVAYRIQAGLADDFDVVVWDQTMFGLGKVTIEVLEEVIRDFQFAVFVFTPDDQLVHRGKTKYVARDNVIFEAGLFIGSLTRKRTFVVTVNGDGMTLPTDLLGVTVAKFDLTSSNMSASLGPVCQQIRDAVNDIQQLDRPHVGKT